MKKKPKKQLLEALTFMKANGLVPTGQGKKTLPSRTPSFIVVWDSIKQIYFLHAEYEKNKGDLWEVTERGDSKYLRPTKGRFRLKKGQTKYDDGRFADYVSLAVIQEVYGLLTPGFDDKVERGIA